MTSMADTHQQPIQSFKPKPINAYFIWIWAGYLVLSTVYIFEKGLPQPADILLMLGVLPGLAWQFINHRGHFSSLYLCGAAFAALTLLINLTHFAFLPDGRFLKSAFYYPYNFMVFCFVVFLFTQNPHQMIHTTYRALAISIIIQLIWAWLFDDISRATGGFAKPNQLAYWALLSAGILFFIRRHEKLNLIDILLLSALLFIQSLSLSKAGIISSFILLSFIFVSPQTRPLYKFALTALLVAGICLAALTQGGFDLLIDKIEALHRISDRLATIGLERDDSLIGRGYDRLWTHPHFMIFGAGEGGFERFTNINGTRELHSGLATILFSYGVTGFALFSAFVIGVFRRQPLICWAVLGCILLFSLPHQAFRFTHFWVFLGIAYGSFTNLRT